MFKKWFGITPQIIIQDRFPDTYVKLPVFTPTGQWDYPIHPIKVFQDGWDTKVLYSDGNFKVIVNIDSNITIQRMVTTICDAHKKHYQDGITAVNLTYEYRYVDENHLRNDIRECIPIISIGRIAYTPHKEVTLPISEECTGKLQALYDEYISIEKKDSVIKSGLELVSKELTKRNVYLRK